MRGNESALEFEQRDSRAARTIFRWAGAAVLAATLALNIANAVDDNFSAETIGIDVVAVIAAGAVLASERDANQRYVTATSALAGQQGREQV